MRGTAGMGSSGRVRVSPWVRRCVVARGPASSGAVLSLCASMARHSGVAVITQVEDVAACGHPHSELISTLLDALRRPLLRDLTEQRLLLQGQVRIVALQLADAETART
jgi:hypothetical protein